MTDDELLAQVAGTQGMHNPEWVRGSFLAEVRRLREINALYAKQRDEAETDRAELKAALQFELDECALCDEPTLPECARCERIRAALA